MPAILNQVERVRRFGDMAKIVGKYSTLPAERSKEAPKLYLDCVWAAAIQEIKQMCRVQGGDIWISFTSDRPKPGNRKNDLTQIFPGERYLHLQTFK